jgi:peptidyl-prolyl cis-trans isomerase SurA
MKRIWWCTFAGAALLFMLGCKRSQPANVAATVNNRVISYAELEKNFQSQAMANQEGSSEDQVNIQKLELLRNMIDNEIMVQRAEKMGLTRSIPDVEEVQ